MQGKKIFISGITLFFMIAGNLFASGSKDKDIAGEYFAIGEGYAELKKYDKAVEFFKLAEKSLKYKNAAQYNLAQVYAMKNDWTNCLKYLEPIYIQVPDNIKIASAYAYALSSAGKEKKAIEIYKKIYSASPETPVYFFNYVRLLINSKRYEDASKLLDENKEKFDAGDGKKTLTELKEKIEDILYPSKKKKNDKKEKTENSTEKKEKLQTPSKK